MDIVSKDEMRRRSLVQVIGFSLPAGSVTELVPSIVGVAVLSDSIAFTIFIGKLDDQKMISSVFVSSPC